MHVLPAFRLSVPAAARAGLAALCLATALGATGPGLAETAGTDRLIMSINGVQIHESDLQVADEIMGRNVPTMDPVERRGALTSLLIDIVICSQAAKAQHIGDEAQLQRRADFVRNEGLMSDLLIAAGKRAATEEAVRKAYDELVVAKAEPELHLRHLVFRVADKTEATDAAAKEKAVRALDRVKKGEDFAAVFADTAEDPSLKPTGGDFEWRTRTEMGKEYAAIAFVMKPGDVSAPFKTDYGWHVIKLEGQRMRKPPEFNAIHDRMVAVVERKTQIELLDKLRKEAKVERFDEPAQADRKVGQ